MRDLMNDIHPKVAIAPVVATDNTALVGLDIDRTGYDSLTFVLGMGTLADVDATFAVLVEHADDNGSGAAGSYAAVADEELVGTEALAGFTFAADNACRKIGYIGGKKWCRITVTPSGNTGNAPIAALAILGHPSVKPTANPPA
ncbi:MAG: hypothetical protein C0503_00850 [Gemmatimonas sp.]|nr:hypothetical protein [Gemmatimonas sp.]